MKNIQSIVISTLVAIVTIVGTFTAVAKGYVSTDVFNLFKDQIVARLDRIETKQDLILERLPSERR